MSEPTHEHGVPPRMRFTACRSARVLTEGVPDTLVVREEHRASIRAKVPRSMSECSDGEGACGNPPHSLGLCNGDGYF